MRLVVPFLDDICPVDRRLIELAEFLGIDCLTIRLDKSSADAPEFLERAIVPREACCVINPSVLHGWLGGDTLPSAVGSALVTRFPHLLIHSPRMEPFDSSLLNVLS